MVTVRNPKVIKILFMVNGEEGRDKGETASPNNGRVGFALPPSPFTLPPKNGASEIYSSLRTVLKTFLVGFLLFSLPVEAAFQAFVDRNPVAEGESLTLTLSSDENLDGNPDLSVLRQDFEILNQSKGSSMQIINGSVTRSLQWQITLSPKRNGQLQIPAIKAGGQSTQPIMLNVTRADQAQAAQQNGELFVEVSAEPHSAYIQQQILFTVRLYRKVELGNNSVLSEPKFPDMDAMVERLGEDKSYQTNHNGQAYAVIERRYAVYPRKAGQFSSTPVQFDGEIIESSRGGGVFMFDPFGQTSRHKRAVSKVISLMIKPAPAALAGAGWLPAGKLQLTEQWSENPPKFIAGEPITRTVVISSNGLPAAQLPVIGTEPLAGFKLYPDQPVLKDNKSDNGISGIRTQKTAIIPTEAGSFTLPALEVKWWNVNTDRMETALLPARNIVVLPGSATHTGANPVQASTAANPVETATTSGDSTIDSTQAKVDTGHEKLAQGWWPWLSLFFGLGWLATLLLWWMQTRKKPQVMKTESVSATTLRQLEAQIKQSCMNNDAVQAKSELLVWAKLVWQNNPPNSLTALAGRCHPELAIALKELDRALYGQGSKVWQGEALWRLFSQYKPVASVLNDENNQPLKPLFLAS
jgi:hypothetical protein